MIKKITLFITITQEIVSRTLQCRCQRKTFALRKFGFRQGRGVITEKKCKQELQILRAAQTVVLQSGAPFGKALRFLQAWEWLSKSVHSLKPLLCCPKDHWIEVGLYLVPKKAVWPHSVLHLSKEQKSSWGVNAEWVYLGHFSYFKFLALLALPRHI